MRTRYLFLLMALCLLSLSSAAQIDPVPHNWGYLPLYPLAGQVALRESPGSETVLAMLSECAYIEPMNEVVTVEGIEWRRVRYSEDDGWMRVKKANGTIISVALTTPDECEV